MSTLPKDFNPALKMYEKFHQLDHKNVTTSNLVVPETLVHVGSAEYVMYRSDKWENKNHDYIHEHGAGVKCCLGREGSKDFDGKLISVPHWILEVKTYALLGKCLGFAFDYQGGVIEAKTKAPLPEIYTIPSGSALLVVEGKRKVTAILWGGHLNVTARGIVG